MLNAMAIACSCHGVRDQAIRDAASSGASTVGEVTDATLAGASCGGCHPTIEMLLAAELALAAALGPVRDSVTAA
jgi:NAD(P)H-nitrite reductase large subunit